MTRKRHPHYLPSQKAGGGVSFIFSLLSDNQLLSNQSSCQGRETLWRHCNGFVLFFQRRQLPVRLVCFPSSTVEGVTTIASWSMPHSPGALRTQTWRWPANTGDSATVRLIDWFSEWVDLMSFSTHEGHIRPIPSWHFIGEGGSKLA